MTRKFGFVKIVSKTILRRFAGISFCWYQHIRPTKIIEIWAYY